MLETGPFVNRHRRLWITIHSLWITGQRLWIAGLDAAVRQSPRVDLFDVRSLLRKGEDMTVLPMDYLDRVYAGVLGKVIGVYVGRPFEGWSHERIVSELGEITYYVHERLDKPLIVIDDDISGHFHLSPRYARPCCGTGADARAVRRDMAELSHRNSYDALVGRYGDVHRAYRLPRLKSGIPAPESGSMALNGRIVSEQIGAQIFIDGWGFICPGDPERAADLACRAGRREPRRRGDLWRPGYRRIWSLRPLSSAACPHCWTLPMSLIPRDSLIYRLIADVREWHAHYPSWYDTFPRIVECYGYHQVRRQLPHRAEPRGSHHGAIVQRG